MATVTESIAAFADLNALILQLQNSPGQISADDQATLDAAVAKAASLTAKADALVVPAPPPAPPS